MAEDEHQRGDEGAEPADEAGRPSGPMQEEERDPRPTDVVPEAGSTGSAGSPGAGGSGGRLEELMAKRRETGLTDAEAEELGTLLAEQEGKPYSSAQSLKRGPSQE